MPFKLSEKERDENDNRKREIERKKNNFCNKHCVRSREKCFISKMNKEVNARNKQMKHVQQKGEGQEEVVGDKQMERRKNYENFSTQ